LEGADAPCASAWGDVGHRVIYQIAYKELKPEIKARVGALVAIDPKYRTFPDGCTWPDVFPRQRSPEHYVDVPRPAKGIEVGHPCPVADRCLTAQAATVRERLKMAGVRLGAILNTALMTS
jgi:nuclease S1